MHLIIRFLLARAAERSTAAGLAAALLGLLGYTSPELVDGSTNLVIGLAGLALSLLPTGGTPQHLDRHRERSQ